MSHKPSQNQVRKCETCPHVLMSWEDYRDNFFKPPDIAAIETGLMKTATDPRVQEFLAGFSTILIYKRFEEAKRHIADPKGYEGRSYTDGLNHADNLIKGYMASKGNNP